MGSTHSLPLVPTVVNVVYATGMENFMKGY